MSSSAYALPRSNGVRSWHAWSPEEDRHLRRLAGTGTLVSDIAEELGRSASAVRARAFELGLRLASGNRQD
ncbi:MAG: hypothetical protein L6R19_05520 [Alphaproteobacteria bacterium]|nr:hypothetical protein [Alphaproteobacteria bacterium]